MLMADILCICRPFTFLNLDHCWGCVNTKYFVKVTQNTIFQTPDTTFLPGGSKETAKKLLYIEPG